jgi:hypothetical protein
MMPKNYTFVYTFVTFISVSANETHGYKKQTTLQAFFTNCIYFSINNTAYVGLCYDISFN